MPFFEKTTPSACSCSYFSDDIRIIPRRVDFDILVQSKSLRETIFFESRKHGYKIYVSVFVWNTKKGWGQTLGLLQFEEKFFTCYEEMLKCYPHIDKDYYTEQVVKCISEKNNLTYWEDIWNNI